MGKIGDVYYVVSIDSSGLPQLAKKEGDKAGKAFGTGMTGSIKSNLKGGLAQGLGIGAALTGVGAVTMGIGALSDVIGDAISDASNLQEAVSKSDAVFGDSADEMETWAETASDAFGQSKRQALEAAGTFGNLIQAFGIGSDKATEMSKSMVQLASDLASFNNTSVDDALIALRAGLSGESEPLKRYGVALNDVRLKEEAMRLGLIKTAKGTLPIAIKTQAAYSLILKDTALAQGDFERTSDGLANTQKTLTAQMEDVSAEIGETLLPLALELAKAFKDDVVPALRAFADAIDDTRDAAKDANNPLVAIGDLMSDVFKSRTDEAKTGLGELNDTLTDFVSDLFDAITPWDTWTLAVDDARKAQDEMAETAREAGRGIGVAASAAKDLKVPVVKATVVVKDLGDEGEDAGEKLKEAARKALRGWRDYAAKILGLARDEVQTAYDIIDDRAALSAANTETAELRKIIATGNATKEQKRRYQELGEEQAFLLIDLAENGVKSGKTVNTAVEQMRQRLKTATGQEKKAIEALLRALERVSVKAREIRTKINALVESGIFLPGGDRGRASGGPVNKGEPYVVGETQPELFVPDTSGYIYPDVPSGMAASTTTIDSGVTINLLDRGVGVRSVNDIASVTKSLRRQGFF